MGVGGGLGGKMAGPKREEFSRRWRWNVREWWPQAGQMVFGLHLAQLAQDLRLLGIVPTKRAGVGVVKVPGCSRPVLDPAAAPGMGSLESQRVLPVACLLSCMRELPWAEQLGAVWF